MRWSTIWSEVWRNIATGTCLAGLLALGMAIMGAVVTAADTMTIDTILIQVREFRASGGDILKVAAEGQIDPLACDGISQSSTVEASGAFSPAAAMTVLAMPLTPLNAYSATPGFSAVLGIEDRFGAGVWMDEALANRIGIVPGEQMDTVNGPMRLAGTYRWPEDGRDARLGFSVVIPDASSRVFDECWMKEWPIAEGNEGLLRSTALVTPEELVELPILPVNLASGSSLDAHVLFEGRTTRYAGIVTYTVSALIGFISIRRRRLEYADALHTGQSRFAQMTVALIETLVWAVAGTGAGLAFVASLIRFVHISESPPVLLLQIRVLILSVLGALSGAAVGLMSIRRNSIYRYFKQR